jgi:hypothetical protein
MVAVADLHLYSGLSEVERTLSGKAARGMLETSEQSGVATGTALTPHGAAALLRARSRGPLFVDFCGAFTYGLNSLKGLRIIWLFRF